MKRYFNETLAISNRILIELVRMKRSLIFWVVFPTLMLLLFGLIYSGGSSSKDSFDLTAPGILIGAALFLVAWEVPFRLLLQSVNVVLYVDCLYLH